MLEQLNILVIRKTDFMSFISVCCHFSLADFSRLLFFFCPFFLLVGGLSYFFIFGINTLISPYLFSFSFFSSVLFCKTTFFFSEDLLSFSLESSFSHIVNIIFLTFF